MTEDFNSQIPIFRQICGALAVNVLSMCNGISASWSSVVQDKIEKSNNPISSDPINKEDFSWVSSALYMGGFLGIFIWNHVADKFGRKFNGYALALTQVIGWLGIIFANSIIQLITSRFIMGLGGAGIITSSQLYINETANAKIKGPLCSLLLIAMQVGYVFVFTLGSLLPYHIFNYACLSVSIIFILIFYWLPESPLYLLMCQKQNEAEEVLLWFSYGNEDAAEQKMIALTQSMSDNIKPAPLKELISNRQMTLTSIFAIISLAGHQLSGYSFISSYTVEIFEKSQTSAPTRISSILVYSIQFITSCAIGFLVAYVPKRLIMLVSYFIASLSLASLALFPLWKSEHKFISHFDWLPTVSLVIFIICYSSGIGPVSYMLIAEMFPPRLLNNVISVGLNVSIPLAFTTVKIYPWFLKTLQFHGTFLLYSLNNAILALLIAIFMMKFAKEPKPERAVEHRLEKM